MSPLSRGSRRRCALLGKNALRCFLGAAAAISISVFGPVTQPAQAQEHESIADSLISFDTLRVVCAQIAKAKLAGYDATKVSSYCDLPLSVSAPALEWDKWDSADIPSPTEISEERKTVDQFIKAHKEQLSKASGLSERTLLDQGLSEIMVSQTLNQSAILWGLTDFIVDRARENVNEYALGRLSKALCAVRLRIVPVENAPTFQMLPTSCDILGQVMAGGKVPGLGALRDALRQDLEVLPRTLIRNTAPELLHSTAVDRNARETAGILLLAAELAYRLRSDGQFLRSLSAPADSVDAAAVGLDCDSTPAAAALYELSALAGVLSRGAVLEQDRDDRIEQIGFAIKTLVINAQWSGLSKRWPKGAACIGSSITRKGSRLFSPRRFFLLAVALNEVLDDVRKSEESATSGIVGSAAPDGKQLQLAHARRLVESAFELIELTLRSRYDTPSPGLLNVVSQFQKASDALVRRDYGGAATGALRVSQALYGVTTPTSSLLANAEPYVGLVADIAEADDAEGVTQALSRAAAPRSSYLRKRAPPEQGGKIKFGKVYFAVNAYAGAVAGWERLESTKNTKTFVAPFIPVGLEVGVPLSRDLSLGLYGHAIDIGALGSYRLNSEADVNAAPNVNFEQVFSPGLAVVVGVSRIPLTIGCQLVAASPKLRTITSSGTTVESDITRRTAIFVAFDIRLF